MSENFIFADLVDRWCYTRRGLSKLRDRDPEFPKPFAAYPSGRGNRWRLEDIEVYEKLRPELLSPTLKKRKVVGYLLALQKGGRR